MKGTVGVPKREDGVVVETLGAVDVAIEAAVLTVGIHIDARVNHGVVERGVEHGFLVSGAFAFHGGKFAVPLPPGLLAECFETSAVGFGLQVEEGAFCAYGGKCHLQRQFVRIPVVEVEIGHYVAPCHLRKIVVDIEFPPESAVGWLLAVAVTVAFQRFAQGDGKECVVAACPSVGDAVAREEGVVLHAEACPKGLPVVVVDAVCQVEDAACVSALGEGVAVYAHAWRGGELCPDAVVLEHHLIISCRCLLRSVREARTVSATGSVGGTGIQPECAHLGLYEQVAEIGMSRAAQMGVAETDDGGVFVAVACAVVVGPGLVFAPDIVGNGVGVGAQLYDAEGCAGSGKGVSHACGADEGIHPVRKTGGQRFATGCGNAGKDEGGEKEKSGYHGNEWKGGLCVFRRNPCRSAWAKSSAKI